MPLPVDLTKITVTSSRSTIAGGPESGSITFDPGQPIIDAADNLILEGPVTRQVQGGVMVPVTLPCTDNAGLNPPSWTYQVTVAVGATTRKYSIALPHTLGSTVDLADLTPVSPAPPATAFDAANTWTKPQTFGGSPPMIVPGASGDVLTLDGAGNVTPEPPAVMSVNSQTGAVVLDAADVGADTSGAAAAAQTAAEAHADTVAAAAQAAAEAASVPLSSLPLGIPSGGTGAATAAAARTALGLGTAATHPAGDFDASGAAAGALGAAEAYTDLETARAEAAESSLASGVTANATAISIETSRAQAAEGLAAQKSANLSDLASAGTARTNLGLGSAATQASTAFDTAGAAAAAQAASLQKTSNLSDLASASTARTNLGLGSAAQQNTSAFDAAGAAAAAQATAEAYTDTQVAPLAPKVSPAFTGTPTSPTPAGADSSTKIATTAFVAGAVPSSLPPSGTAGGDLGSTYPNPTVTATHLSAALPIAQGGTGQATASAALAGLGGAAVAGDISGTSAAPQVTATHLSAALPVAQGGTGQATQAAALTALAGTQSAGKVLRSDGTSTALANIQAGDVPTLNQNTTGTAAGLSSTLAVASGGTGQTTRQAAIDALTGTQSAGKVLRSDGTHVTLASIAAGDLPAATTSTQGAVQLDGTATDIQPAGTQAAGVSTKAAAADHVHPSSPVASQTLGSAAASITFSSVPSGYSVLRLLVIGASDVAAQGDRWLVTVNGDSGAHYDLQDVHGANATAGAGVKNAQTVWLYENAPPPGDMPGASATAGVAGILDIQIPNYAGTTFQKVGLWRAGYSDAATAAADQLASNAVIAWRSTAAITSISVRCAGNLVAGTTAYLFLA